MGFIDDVKWVLEQTPDARQIALFSATMPPVIRKIANEHLNNPAQVTIKMTQQTAETIRQRYWMVSGRHKLDALTRILEVEPFDGMIVFVRTKTATEEIAGKLEARGFSVAALNGDITQKQREATVNRLKKGAVDIVVATDVAARGLDVERISHVINYDIPYDTESYIHRIGRTGRAGREGDAILFVAPREKRMLYAIEKVTKKRIEPFQMPTTEVINDRRIAEFKQRITDVLESEDGLELFADIVEQYRQEHNVPANEIAAALAKMAQGDKPLLLKDAPQPPAREPRNPRFDAPEDKRRSTRNGSREQYQGVDVHAASQLLASKVERGMQRYQLDVGEAHGVKAGNIVGAIANELGLESEFIGRVQISDQCSSVDLPEGMPKAVFKELKQIEVCGRRLNAELLDAGEGEAKPRRPRRDAGDRRPPRGKGGAKPAGRGRAKGKADDRGGRKPPRRNKK